MSKVLFDPKATVVIENEYFMVKNEIFDLDFKVKDGDKYRTLNIYEISTYIYLCRCGNQKDNAFPSYNTIAEKIKCSRRKAIDSIKVLNDNGFIYKEVRTNGVKNQSNIYYINVKLSDLKQDLDARSSAQHAPGSAQHAPGGSAQHAPGSAQHAPKKEQYKKNKSFKQKLNNNIDVNNNDYSNNSTTQSDSCSSDNITKTQQELACSETENSNKELIEKQTHLTLTPNQVKKVSKWDIKKTYKTIELFKRENGEYFSLLEKIYNDSRNFAPNMTKKGKFKNYDQREYDMEELERKLLGWD